MNGGAGKLTECRVLGAALAEGKRATVARGTWVKYELDVITSPAEVI